MAFTFNGIGTRYYGRDHKASDGSYTTTEWATFWWIPLVPLASWRVLREDEKVGSWLWSRQHFQVDRLPLDLGQILRVYLWAVPVVAFIVFEFMVSLRHGG
jgi:hypothetical protein